MKKKALTAINGLQIHRLIASRFKSWLPCHFTQGSGEMVNTMESYKRVLKNYLIFEKNYDIIFI